MNGTKFNKKANKWFGSFLGLFFTILLENLIRKDPDVNSDNLFVLLLGLSNFLIAPVFYLSISFFVDPKKQFNKTDFLHFIFAFLILLLTIVSVFSDDTSEEVHPEVIKTFDLIFNVIFSTQVITYNVASFRKIIRHQATINNLNSNTDEIDLKWLQNISITVLSMAILWIIDILLGLSESFFIFDVLSSLIFLGGILYISTNGLNQKELFPYDPVDISSIEMLDFNADRQSINKTKLMTAEKLESLKSQIVARMINDKPYLDPELNLFNFARLLNVSAHELSYAINIGFDKNFNQFINYHRVEQAKKLLLEKKMDHLNITGIGYEVGFNSKTAFYSAFKINTGQTPSSYKKGISHIKRGAEL